MWSIFILILLVAAVGSLLFVLRPEEVVEEPFSPRKSHAAYRDGLEQMELNDTEMGSAWISAAIRAERNPTAVTPPVREEIFFDPAEPDAIAYSFPVSRGRRVTIDIAADHRRYFADVFRLNNEGTETDELIASRSPDGDQIVFEARSNGFYLLRLQPELLRGGRYVVSMGERAALAFPVEGASVADIWSFFGDGRDAGARTHHGVDIFAPRGTPVLAVSDSEVIRVGQRERGGNVVVLQDSARGINLYYAHLDEHRTTRGAQVRAGDVIGTVGNTGNAITTPPHLHIGIYQGSWRNPVDPWAYFINPVTVEPPPLPQDAPIGEWMVTTAAVTVVNGVPAAGRTIPRYRNRNPLLQGAGDTFAGAEIAVERAPTGPQVFSTVIAAGTPVRVLGAAGEALRVRTPGGYIGFIGARTAAGTAQVVAISEADRFVPEHVGERRVARDPISGDAIGVVEPDAAVVRIASVGSGELVRLESGRVVALQNEVQ